MSRGTTTMDAQPQPAKERHIENEVPLYLPAEVVVPPFYEQERDAGAISTALLLGADAVCHLRSQAEQRRLQELLDKKESQLEQRVLELQAELSALSEKANEDVARRVAERTLVLTQTLQVRDENFAALESACQNQRDEIATNLSFLEKQIEDTSQLTARLQAARGEERLQAFSGAQLTLNAHRTHVADSRKNVKALLGTDEKREQRDSEQTKSHVEDKSQATERGKAPAYSKNGADKKPTLRELIEQAFEERDGVVQEISEDKAVAQICGLQTRWYRREKNVKQAKADQNVKQAKADHIKSELEAHLEVDVAFLVALQTDIAGHTEHLFDVEFIKTGQALIYVNQFTASDNPTKTLQVFARPLLRLLLRIKDVLATTGADAANLLRRRASQWVETVKTHLTEIAADRKELQSDMSKSQEQFEARRKRIEKRAEDLGSLQQDMEPSFAAIADP